MSEDNGLSPERQMEIAEQAMAGWRFLLDSMDGQVAETMRHGWTEEQARELVLGFARVQFASLIRGLRPPAE